MTSQMARPIRRTKESRRSLNTSDASPRVSVRSPKVTVNTKKEHHEEDTSQELEAGGILDDDQVNQRLKEAWEHDDSKDEL